MPKVAKEMSAKEVRSLKRPGMHAVGGVSGLLLQITPSGAKSWVLRVKVGDKRRHIGLGGFPDVPLADARNDARTCKRQIRQGIDPVIERRNAWDALREAHAKAMTFADAARRCHAAKAPTFRNDHHRKGWLNSLENHAFPVLGNMEVAEIELPHILKVLEPIWQEKTETAGRVRQRMEAVLTWATVSGYREGDNPARWDGNLKEVLPTPSKIMKVKHHKALPWQDVPAFMVELHKRDGMAARALEFIVYTAARSGEVRLATWDEIDLDNKLWTVPGERAKTGKAHKVPLSSDAMKLLKALPKMKGSNYVFPNSKGGPLSDMSISAVCRRMKVEAVPHGFRSSFKDWARSRTRYADEVSELALAHVNSDATRAAYARDELLPQRTKLMAEWARYLAGARNVAELKAVK